MRSFNIQLTVFSALMLLIEHACATSKWASFTFDNDLFIGNDSGYTNGLYIAIYNIGTSVSELPDPDFWQIPLKWSMPEGYEIGVNIYMAGQTLTTPNDITLIDPPETDIPYSALLEMNNSYIAVFDTYADISSTTIGVIGPIALGEEAQNFIHGLTGSDEAMGWDTQLDNEFVFKFGRGRLWRTWVAESGKFDFLTSLQAGIGTLESHVSAGAFFRYGRGLDRSFATILLNRNRTTNPEALLAGWQVYIGLSGGRIFNQINMDGNTFKDSRSIDYDHNQLGYTAGFSYAWNSLAISFAINDTNLFTSHGNHEALENITQYGSFTIGWRR